MIIAFAAVAIVLVVAVHWYLWVRLVRDVSAPKSLYRRVGTVLVILFPGLQVLFRVLDGMGAPFGLRQVVAWPAMLWLALLLYLILALLVGELIRPLLLRWMRRRAADGPAEPARDGAGAGGATAAEGADGEAADAATETGDAATVGAGVRGRAANAAGCGAASARGGAGGSRGAAAEGADAEAPSGDAQSGDGDGASAGEAGCGTVDGAELSRRLFVARSVAIGATAVAAGTVGYGVWAARQLATKHVTVEIANLPRTAEGYRITVVGDMHLSPTLGRSHSERVVEAINRTEPDIVTMVGDLTDAGVEELRSASEPLGRLRSVDGVFFVTGNHEYYVGARSWVDRVRELGMTVLENSYHELPSGIDVVGVNDPAAEDYDEIGPDMAAALEGRDSRRPSVLLAHQPVQIHDAVDHGVDLVVSGHTHGGQVWPGPIIAGWVNPTLAGLERYGDSQLFVTRGAGTWGPPVRVGAEPDITVLTLTAARS